MEEADRRSPGPSLLALLAAPGLLCWGCWAYAFLAPSGASGRETAAAAAFPVGFVALGAGIAARSCCAPRALRWLVSAKDIVAFAGGVILHVATGRPGTFA
ncbi:MAG: hypothetical protein L6Q95_13750 [Planctomycetes bacterium]|nr:hypothetical protein [Planctomycetota bacterium]